MYGIKSRWHIPRDDVQLAQRRRQAWAPSVTRASLLALAMLTRFQKWPCCPVHTVLWQGLETCVLCVPEVRIQHLSFFLLEILYFITGVSDHGGHAVNPPSCLDPTERPERGDLAGQWASVQMAGGTIHGPATCWAHVVTWEPPDISSASLQPGRLGSNPSSATFLLSDLGKILFF